MAKRSEYENYIDYRRAVVRESQKRRRMKAAEDGLCTICCLNIPDDGHRTCKACRMRVSERRRNVLGG